MRARDLIGRLLAVNDVGNHDAATLGGKRARIMPADPLGAACNDRNTAVYPSHNALLLVQSWFLVSAGVVLDEFGKGRELLADELHCLLIGNLPGLGVDLL